MRGTTLAAAFALGCSTGSGGGPADASAPDTAPPACVYPAGPYGHQMGDILDPSLSWQGYLEGSAQATTVAVTDYYDCDGRKGIAAILLDQSATWCGECINEAYTDGPLMSGAWAQEGVKWITLMAQDAQSNPATLDTAMQWRNQYGLDKVILCADPMWTLQSFGIPPSSGAVNGFPTNVVVDPRTMRITAIQPADAKVSVDQLAKQNQPASGDP